MNKTVTVLLSLAVGLAAGLPLGGRLMSSRAEAESPTTTTSAAAVADAIGAQDISGPYEVQEGWPKDLATLPNHEQWTYGGARGIFAESPNRVFLLGGGELPAMPRPALRFLTEVGPNVPYPVGGLPWRNANNAAPPAGGGAGNDPARGMELWSNVNPPRELGVHSRWEHCIIVVNAELPWRTMKELVELC